LKFTTENLRRPQRSTNSGNAREARKVRQKVWQNRSARKLTHERLYTTATVLALPRTTASTGEYLELSELTGLKTFITNFAGHIAAEAAREA
jgi:hypothetical protein